MPGWGQRLGEVEGLVGYATADGEATEEGTSWTPPSDEEGQEREGEDDEDDDDDDDDDEYEDDDEVARQEELELLAALQLSLEEARQEARRSEQPIAEPSQRDE